jgi:hypothetical protein
MQPDSSRLRSEIKLEYPEIGFYDAPDMQEIFAPLMDTNSCVFSCFNAWLKGKTLHLTKDNFGCTTCGRVLAGYNGVSKEKLTEFKESSGAKYTQEIKNALMGSRHAYHNEHANIYIGILRPEAWEYLKTVTLFVDPDQLSSLMTLAYYDCKKGDPPPVVAPFGTACSHFVPAFKDLNVPQAVIGSTDMMMRRYIPAKVLSFTMTRPMYEKICMRKNSSFNLGEFFQKMMGFKANR